MHSSAPTKSAIIRQIEQARETERRSHWTTDELLLISNELRLAVHRGGGSIDPEENFELRAQLSSVLLPYIQVNRILKECEVYERGNLTYYLPMDYDRQRVALMCKVRTSNLEQLKRRLVNFLRENKSRFFNRHFFSETGLIEAHIPDFDLSNQDFYESTCKVALWCKATHSRVIDYDKCNVLFKCQPDDMEEVVDRLKQCGYKIIHSELGYSSRKPLVTLTFRQMESYKEFLEQLKEDEDVVRVYDNVRY